MLLPITKKKPKYITIGAHYRCNANCKFCLGGDYPDFTFKIYKEFFEKKLLSIMRQAEHVGFCGYGEILLMPGITDFLDYINKKSLPSVTKVFTTNGLPLTEPIREKLVDGKYSLIISLHGSKKKLHEFIVGRKGFDKIKDNIKNLVELRNKKQSSLHINLVFLITNYNIDDLPDFIKMAGELGADRVTCTYLTVFSPEHLKMSCYFQKEKTRQILKIAGQIAEDSGLTLSVPPIFGCGDDGGGQICDDPWNFFYTEVQGSVIPCCFAGGHIGYLNKTDFEDIWNGPGYLRLREGLLGKEPFKWCRGCYRYKKSNVDDIGSHITFRPEPRAEILEYIKETGEDKIKKQARLI